MKRVNRRRFLGLGGAALAAMNVPAIARHSNHSKEETSGLDQENSGPVPMIHVGDIFHHHGDPDDHWDLASVYALAYSGYVDLKGIVIDWPPRKTFGDPDVMGVAQLNYITGLVVPAVTGTPYTMKHRNDIQADADPIDHQGINWVIETLRESPSPVIINVVGASTDIALAIKKEPELFASKCKAIYQNAGSAITRRDKPIEYNTGLDPFAYATLFDAPCPVYWLPCFHDRATNEVGGYGSYYRFLQNDILRHLPKKLLNFFLFMLGWARSHKWLEYLNGEPDQRLLDSKGDMYRAMWCTAGFLHAAGKKVTSEGDIVPLDSEGESVCSFVPVKVDCDDEGYTDWEKDPHSDKRFIFHVDDEQNYEKAMTTALRDLLLQLPQS
ncbi:MAG: nucleoside hydrolase [Bacteroidota bacterium]